MDTSEKTIQDQFKTLPPDVQQALNNSSWREQVRAIAKKESFDEEKSLAFENETMFILYDFLPPEEYAQNLEEELGVDTDTANRLALQVDNEIFAKLSAALDSTSQKTPIISTAKEIEIAPSNLPMIEPGETAHDSIPKPKISTPTLAAISVPVQPAQPKSIVEEKMAAPITVSAPVSYTPGQDPYREPLQ